MKNGNGKTAVKLPMIDSIVQHDPNTFEIVLNLVGAGKNFKFKMILTRKNFEELVVGLKEFWEAMSHE